jgi:hypothetical protein
MFKLLGQIAFFLFSGLAFGQNAPVTAIHDTAVCSGSSITIPVRVTNFKNIGSLSLKLQYNINNLSFVSWTNTSGFPGLELNAGLPGTLVAGGFTYSTGGITLPDNSIFFTITFNYSGGSSNLNWFDDGASCEYTGPAPNFPVLIDIPKNLFYINGAVTPELSANFSASAQFPEVYDTVSFSDLSSGSPTTWNWVFNPSSYVFVNGTNQNSQSPEVSFITNGPFTVNLTIGSSTCINTIQSTDYIHAGTPGLWTGLVSTNWQTPANWHNWMVPDNTTDVTIPPVASNWPEFAGDFSIGVHCFNLTIQGLTGQMTVTGDFIIP